MKYKHTLTDSIVFIRVSTQVLLNQINLNENLKIKWTKSTSKKQQFCSLLVWSI